LKRGRELSGERQITYSLRNENADVYAAHIRMMDGSYEFDVVMKDHMIDNIVLHMGGMHNVENIIAAVAVADSLGIGNEKIKSAVASFRGVKRRFEYIIKTKNLVFIDDYAHHPEELRALITGAKTLFRQKKCTVIFQPHLYTRTRDFADGFAEVLDLADEVVLLPVYPARELPIESVNSELVLNKMKIATRSVKTKEELMEWVRNDYAKKIDSKPGNVLITAGAGDIDTLLTRIKEGLETAL